MPVCVEYEPDWVDLVGEHWHHHLMDVKLRDRLHEKQGRSIARWTVRGEHGELAVFVKRHYAHPAWRTWLARLWPKLGWSDAGREWLQLRRARRLGLNVPRAVAVAEWHEPQLRSTLIVEELSGMLALHEAIPIADALLTQGQF